MGLMKKRGNLPHRLTTELQRQLLRSVRLQKVASHSVYSIEMAQKEAHLAFVFCIVLSFEVQDLFASPFALSTQQCF